jgi:hypothetical protein
MIGDQPKAPVKIMSHRTSLLFTIAASFLVSGCFFSDTPKFLPETAVAIFGEGGRYQGYERLDGDNYKKDEVMFVKRRADRGYDLIDEKGAVQPITFHAIAGGYHVGQARSEKDQPAYSYVVVRVSGDETYIFIPQCDTQDKSLLLRYAVTLTRQFECSIDRVSNPAEFFESIKLGDPTSKLVRE